MIRNIPFYLREIALVGPSCLQILLFLAPYLGLFVPGRALKSGMFQYLFWSLAGLLISCNCRVTRRYANLKVLTVWLPVYVAVWPLVILPSRLCGTLEALWLIMTEWRKKVVCRRAVKVALYPRNAMAGIGCFLPSQEEHPRGRSRGQSR